MTRRFLAPVVVLLATFGGTAIAQNLDQKIDLKVLYAGVPSSPRTKDFTDFLTKTFTGVGSAALDSLDQKAVDGFDVVIVDSPTPYQEGKFASPKVADFAGPSWGKPTILMGAAGGTVLGKLRIKLNWL